MRILSIVVAVVVWSGPAWASLPSDVDPVATPNLGPREDAVGKYAKDPNATALLIEVLKTDPAPEIRARAARALFERWAIGMGDLAAQRSIAIWAADNGDNSVRASAVRALGDTGDDYTLVTKYLDDSNEAVRTAAYTACERWAARHPDRASEVYPLLSGRELSMEGKARRLLEKVRTKMP